MTPVRDSADNPKSTVPGSDSDSSGGHQGDSRGRRRQVRDSHIIDCHTVARRPPLNRVLRPQAGQPGHAGRRLTAHVPGSVSAADDAELLTAFDLARVFVAAASSDAMTSTPRVAAPPSTSATVTHPFVVVLRIRVGAVAGAQVLQVRDAFRAAHAHREQDLDVVGV